MEAVTHELFETWKSNRSERATCSLLEPPQQISPVARSFVEIPRVTPRQA